MNNTQDNWKEKLEKGRIAAEKNAGKLGVWRINRKGTSIFYTFECTGVFTAVRKYMSRMNSKGQALSPKKLDEKVMLTTEARAELHRMCNLMEYFDSFHDRLVNVYSRPQQVA